MTARCRVLVVGRGAPERGGIPSYIDMLLHGSEDLGHDVECLNLAPGRVVAGGDATLANVARSIHDVRSTAEAARSADVVNIHSALAPVVTAMRAGVLASAAHRAGARVVIHAHGGRLAQAPLGSLASLVTRRALAASDLVVAVSRTVHDAVLHVGLPAERVLHVPNGIDLSRFRGTTAPHRPARVLFVGGLTKRKGVLDLGRASSELLRRGLDHELWLVGGAPDEGANALAEVYRALPPHVKLLGQKPSEELPSIYAQCDVFCLPSWWEAMPFTVMEAQAAGLPVVASDVGDVRDMVLDGETGLIVPPRDDAALTSALGKLLGDESVRLRMGERARAEASRFDQRATLQKLGRAFSDLMEAP